MRQHESDKIPYIAPPLPKAEILGGIGGLLDQDVFRTRPRALTHVENDSTSSLEGPPAKIKSKPKVARPAPVAGVPFDLERLPFATGHKSTEAIIDALFNPTPSTSPRPSPFTFYETPEEQRMRKKEEKEEKKLVQWDKMSSSSTGTSSGDGHHYTIGGAGGRITPLSWASRSSSNLHEDSVPRPKWWSRTPKGSRPTTPM